MFTVIYFQYVEYFLLLHTAHPRSCNNPTPIYMVLYEIANNARDMKKCTKYSKYN